MPSRKKAVNPHTVGKGSDGQKITRDDIESGLRSVVGEAEQKATATARRLMPVAIAGGVVLLFVIYRLGRRVGTTKSTVVEIRRI